MEDIYAVALPELVEEFGFGVEYAASNYQTVQVTVEDVARPGIQLAGYFEHFDARRLEVLGNMEMSYLSRMEPAERERAFDQLFAQKIPALIIARDTQPPQECLEMAKKHDITLLSTQETTSVTISNLIN